MDKSVLVLQNRTFIPGFSGLKDNTVCVKVLRKINYDFFIMGYTILETGFMIIRWKKWLTMIGSDTHVFVWQSRLMWTVRRMMVNDKVQQWELSFLFCWFASIIKNEKWNFICDYRVFDVKGISCWFNFSTPCWKFV